MIAVTTLATVTAAPAARATHTVRALSSDIPNRVSHVHAPRRFSEDSGQAIVSYSCLVTSTPWATQRASIGLRPDLIHGLAARCATKAAKGLSLLSRLPGDGIIPGESKEFRS